MDLYCQEEEMNGDGDSADDLLKDSPRGVEHADTGFKDNTVIAHSTGIDLLHNMNNVPLKTCIQADAVHNDCFQTILWKLKHL